MSRASRRETSARRLAGTAASSLAGVKASRVALGVVFPEWMTWAQRAVYRHSSFHGRVVIPQDPDGCWEWTRGHSDGYGRLRFEGRVWYAHRLSRFVAFGDLPEATCHSCDNPPCVNPEHLRAGTLSDNTAEMWAKGRARVFPSLTPDRAAIVAGAGRRWIGRKGGRAAIEGIALREGVSVRTVYRLATGTGLPKCYQRLATTEAVA